MHMPANFSITCDNPDCETEMRVGDLVYRFDGGNYCSLECRDAAVEDMTDTCSVEEIWEGRKTDENR